MHQVRQGVHGDNVTIEVGRLYCVYGMSLSSGIPLYLLCENERDWYPVPHYAVFFEVVDNTLPSDWVYVEDSYNLGRYALLPKAWASDPCFLEKLVDGDLMAVAAFSDIKENYGR
ncbi:hypothetical protein [Pirellulimonas nuda]|uniref:hypothetical protein n=1 Tax=Pirellulimonas nuda TaxID=2528009 RepID=UPI0011A73CF9|nr:hypothetical protein [Pirellulimonas nuda]